MGGCVMGGRVSCQVTLLVKDNMPGQITLAIGDGANDVSMIQVRAGRDVNGQRTADPCH